MTPEIHAKLDEKIRRAAYRAAFNRVPPIIFVDTHGDARFEPNTLSPEELLHRRWSGEEDAEGISQ
jgi:hypothetical protein